MRYHESKPEDILAEIKKAPIAYVPWGAHEWHGVHNTPGVDGVKAGFLADSLCKELGGVVFPTVFCGYSTVARYGFPLSIEFRAQTVAAVAQEHLDAIAEMGFKVIVLILGHWGSEQGGIMRSAASIFNGRQSKAVAWAVQEDEMIDNFAGGGEDHGGMEETSFMLAALPEAVDLSRLPVDREMAFDRDGVLGVDPRQGASAAHGQELLAQYVRNTADRIRDMLEK